ncbi:MAG: hypothetical protein Q9212_005839 [Teloschistes hypoglaucus]
MEPPVLLLTLAIHLAPASAQEVPDESTRSPRRRGNTSAHLLDLASDDEADYVDQATWMTTRMMTMTWWRCRRRLGGF